MRWRILTTLEKERRQRQRRIEREERRKAKWERRKQRRIEREERRKAKWERRKDWHPWFAWYPVRDRENGYTMWMEKVLRKQTHQKDDNIVVVFLSWLLGFDYRPLTLLPKEVGAAE